MLCWHLLIPFSAILELGLVHWLRLLTSMDHCRTVHLDVRSTQKMFTAFKHSFLEHNCYLPSLWVIVRSLRHCGIPHSLLPSSCWVFQLSMSIRRAICDHPELDIKACDRAGNTVLYEILRTYQSKKIGEAALSIVLQKCRSHNEEIRKDSHSWHLPSGIVIMGCQFLKQLTSPSGLIWQ